MIEVMVGSVALDALNDALLFIDEDGRIAQLNAAARRLFPRLSDGDKIDARHGPLYSFIENRLKELQAGEMTGIERMLYLLDQSAYCLKVKGVRLERNQAPGPYLVVIADITAEEFPLEGGRLQDHELENQLLTARKYQEALFTKTWRDEHVSCIAEGRAAYELSGDFFEIGCLDNKYLFVLGDVQSHGIEVAIKAITLQHLCRINLDSMPLAAQLMQKLNRFVFSDQQGSFWSCCMFIGCYDQSSRRLYYSRAGVPEPILLGSDGSYRLLATGDTPLGYFEEEHYRNGMVQINPGDRLILYSDGVTESLQLGSSEAHFGQDRLLASILRRAENSPTEHFVDELVAEVEEFHGGNRFTDDFTLAEVIFS